MEVDLLVVGDAIAAAGIEQVTVAAVYRIVTDILDKQERAFGDFPLANKSRLIAVTPTETARHRSARNDRSGQFQTKPEVTVKVGIILAADHGLCLDRRGATGPTPGESD